VRAINAIALTDGDTAEVHAHCCHSARQRVFEYRLRDLIDHRGSLDFDPCDHHDVVVAESSMPWGSDHADG
jgi:hypothetical protein